MKKFFILTLILVTGCATQAQPQAPANPPSEETNSPCVESIKTSAGEAYDYAKKKAEEAYEATKKKVQESQEDGLLKDASDKLEELLE